MESEKNKNLCVLKEQIIELNEDGIISMETNEEETLRKLGKLVDPKEYELIMKQIKQI